MFDMFSNNYVNWINCDSFQENNIIGCKIYLKVDILTNQMMYLTNDIKRGNWILTSNEVYKTHKYIKYLKIGTLIYEYLSIRILEYKY